MNTNQTAPDTTDTTDHQGFFAHIVDELRQRRAARSAARRLERDLAAYTTAAQIDELLSMLDRYDRTPQTRLMREILARQRMVA